VSLVICKLPKAGLGNQLFPLMRAYTFAHLNELPVTAINYHQLKIGPWIRGEKDKRNYKGFFEFQKNIFGAMADEWQLKKYRAIVQKREPAIKDMRDKKGEKICYLFASVPHYTQYFEGLQENRALVIELFHKMITASVKDDANRFPNPCIGIHVRMGDFRKLKEDEEIGKIGTVRTPENYFVDIVNTIRNIHGSELPATVFTDGSKKELEYLLSLGNINMVAGNNALVDLLLLSRSKIMVTAAGSTFSYWAAFVSDAPVIVHPAYVNLKIRAQENSDYLYEGPLNAADEQLTTKIHSIRFE
jgi:hypothetical protein